jgi:hypothetical protein
VSGLYGPNDAVVSLDSQSFLPTVTGKGSMDINPLFNAKKKEQK